MVLGKVVDTSLDMEIISLKIVTIAKQTNIKPTQIKPEIPTEVETLPKTVEDLPIDNSASQEDKEQENQAQDQAEQETATNMPSKFSLDDFTKMVENVRNENPDAYSQKELIGEREIGERQQRGRGEKNDPTLNPADYIRSKMQPCWLIDKGAKNYQTLRVEIELTLTQQGGISMLKIANDTQIIASSNNGWRAARENVVAALIECAPYGKLKSLEYDEWKAMKLNFQPGDE